MTQSIPNPADSQSDRPRKIFKADPGFVQHWEMCPRAQTMVGQDGGTGAWRILALRCNSWNCEFCAKLKIKRLAWLTENARPNRLLTLTNDPAKWQSPDHCWESTRAMPAELFRSLRRQFNEVEYLKVTELHKNGYPHYHALVRSSFIPHAIIKKRWRELTGAQIVDVRKVSDTFKTYCYLVKYLTKLRSPTWTERHVAYSKNFFNPADMEKMAFPELDNKEKHECHPWVYAVNNYPMEQLDIDNSGNLQTDHEPHFSPGNWTEVALGLPNRDPDLNPKKYQQSLLNDNHQYQEYD